MFLHFNHFPVDNIFLIVVVVDGDYLRQRVLGMMGQLASVILVRLKDRKLSILLGLNFVLSLRNLLIINELDFIDIVLRAVLF